MSLSNGSARLLSSDEVDDLIYFARTGDLDSLKESIDTISHTKSCSTLDVLESAIDIDDEGLGSSSCLLHYPSANGNTDIVQYLLSQMTPSDPTQHTNQQAEETLPKAQRSHKLLNHQNVSGNTALHWAGMNGHLDVVKALIKAGADPGIVNSAGRDAMFESDVSSKEGAAECAVEMLKAYEALEKGRGANTADGNEEEQETNQTPEKDQGLQAEETATENGPDSTS